MPRWTFLCLARPCCASLDLRTLLCHAGPCCATLDLAVPRWTLLCLAGPCCASLDLALTRWTLLCLAEPCCASLDLVGPRWASLGPPELQSSVLAGSRYASVNFSLASRPTLLVELIHTNEIIAPITHKLPIRALWDAQLNRVYCLFGLYLSCTAKLLRATQTKLFFSFRFYSSQYLCYCA